LKQPEDLSRLVVDIPAGLHSRLKMQAAKERRPLRELVIEALKDLLSATRKGGRNA
jgi:hypothetical protein